MKVSAGPIDLLPEDRCVSVGDGRAVVIRVGDGAVAFVNRCLHQASPLTGGWVREGVLSCPLHFWRYHVESGALIGGGPDDGDPARGLEPLPVAIVEGQVEVEIPDPPPTQSLRDQLLARASTYDRAEAHRTHVANQREGR